MSAENIGSYTCTFTHKHKPNLAYESSILLINNAVDSPILSAANLLPENYSEEVDYESEDAHSLSPDPIIQNYALEDRIQGDLLIEFKSEFKPVMFEKDSFSIVCSTRGNTT